ncbi:MAG: hypothetical protein ACRENG_28550 [bacterium]
MNGDLHIDPKFDKTQSWIWTVDTSSVVWKWYVNFNNGYCGRYIFDGDYYVRAVRSGQSVL